MKTVNNLLDDLADTLRELDTWTDYHAHNKMNKAQQLVGQIRYAIEHAYWEGR